MTKDRRVKHVVSLFFMFCLAGINAALITHGNGCYGVYALFSMFVSYVAAIPSMLILFFRSNIVFVKYTKIAAVLTFLLQGIVNASITHSTTNYFDLYFILNLVVAIMSATSMMLLHKTKYLKKEL